MIRIRPLRLITAALASLFVLATALPAGAQPGGGEGPGNQGSPRGAGPGGAGRGGAGRGFGGGLEGGPWDIETESGAVHVDVLTRDVQSPWSIVFLPNGDMLFTERAGRLRVIRDGELNPNEIEGLPEINNSSIGGLMGLALHPDYEQNRLIYFAYSKANPDDAAELALAVARARWNGGTALDNVEDIFVADKDWYSASMSGENNRCCGQGPYSGSYGARIAFDEDSRLYITSGDRNWGERAQDPQSHIGKIIRLNDDGTVPADNPFVDMEGYLPELYTLGHRNPTGLRFDPETGELWSTEFGPRGGEELNRIVAGGNYGWILTTQGEHYQPVNLPEPEPEDLEGMIDPVFAWPPSGNPGNLIVYRGDEFPQWQGDIFVATMTPGGALVRFRLDAEGNVSGRENMLTEIGQRMRDVAEGPDGRIYVLTESSPNASPGAILVLTAGD
jgi:glucose/arabinose dehydrogenase